MRKGLYILLFLLVLTGVGLFVLNRYVAGFSRYSTSLLEELQPEHAALLLGTTKWRVGGGENLYYRYRIDAAERLYRAGKVEKIIVSGANRTIHYNEPRDMKADLVARGIPAKDIISDYAGLRTLDSVVRFRQIFGQTRGIVISQPFHNARAIYIGRMKGIYLQGYNAQRVPVNYSIKTHLREVFAKVVSVFDVELLATAPHHLGPSIDIDAVVSKSAVSNDGDVGEEDISPEKKIENPAVNDEAKKNKKTGNN
jgi:SanA protein